MTSGQGEAMRRRAPRDRRWPHALRVHGSGALLLLGLVGSGCYRYASVPLSAAPGTGEVRVRLTDAAAVRLSPALGAYSNALDGQLSLNGGDSVALAVTTNREYRGVVLDSATEVFHLGRVDVADVQRRELSRGRTVALAAGTLAGFVLLTRAIVQLTNPNPGTDESLPQPPPPQTRIPSAHLFRLRVPFP